METNDVLHAIVDVHNIISGISVHGDDAINMGDAIRKCRSLIYQIQRQAHDED